MEPISTTRRASLWAWWLGWGLGYALLSWAAWVGSYVLIDRVEAAETRWTVWFVGLVFPLLLAFLGGVRLRAPWWIVTAPITTAPSLLGFSIYQRLTIPDGLSSVSLLLIVIYAGATMVAAMGGVLLSELLATLRLRSASRKLADTKPRTVSRPIQLVLGGVGLIVLGLVSGAGWGVLIGRIVIFVGGALAGWWKTWWPGWLWWP